MTNQADRAINITIKEVELVEVGKEKHDETLAKIEAKADKAELDSLKNTVSENQTQLQEQLQSQDEKINTKLDESQVKALIAEAELDDLTLEQVQQEIIKQVADKATTQAVAELTAKIQKLSDQMQEVNTRLAKQIKGGKVHQGAPDPAPARAEEPVAVSDTADEVIEGQDPEIKAIIDNLRLESYQEVMGNDGLQGTNFDKVQIKFNKEVKYNSWSSYIDHATFAKDGRGYYTAKNVNGGVGLAGIFNGIYDEGRDDTSVQVVEVVFINGGVRYVKKFDLIPDDDTDRKVRYHEAY